MTRYVLIRVFQGILVLFLSAVAVFFLARLTGDPISVMLPEDATKEDVEIMTKYLGLDKPVYEQFGIFLVRIFKGDLGRSIHYRLPVTELIAARIPASIWLALAAAVASLVIALPFGVIAAVNRDKWQDVIAKAFAIFGQSIPTFWLGVMLIQVVSVWLGWLPSAGYGSFKNIILPAITLGYHSTAGVLRLTRSSMLDVLRSDFVRLGRIKGLSERVVIWKHALRNALIPIVTFIGIIYVLFLTGAVVAETVFGWPGLGRLSYEAVLHRDYPLIQAIILLFVGIFVFVNLLVDILYVYLDPRVRFVKG